jgi:hypothetical protein
MQCNPLPPATPANTSYQKQCPKVHAIKTGLFFYWLEVGWSGVPCLSKPPLKITSLECHSWACSYPPQSRKVAQRFPEQYHPSGPSLRSTNFAGTDRGPRIPEFQSLVRNIRNSLEGWYSTAQQTRLCPGSIRKGAAPARREEEGDRGPREEGAPRH